jgi:cytochrome c oxidase subunit IV
MAEHGHDHEYTKGGAHAHHILPQRTIFMVAGGLFALMAITIIAAIYMPEPYKGWTIPMQCLALAIAVAKACLVVYYYMGVKFGTRLIKIFAYGGFVWFFMLFIMMIDYTTRPMEPVPGWEKQTSSALPRDTIKNPE